MTKNDKDIVAAYVSRFRRFKRVTREADGWTVVLDVWRQRTPLPDGRFLYTAILATGEQEVGEYIALMDCDFQFPKGHRKVMKDIERSIEEEKAMTRLLHDAGVALMARQKKAQGGKAVLPC